MPVASRKASESLRKSTSSLVWENMSAKPKSMDVTYSKVITATQSTTLTIGTWSGVGVAKSGGAKGSSVAGLLVVFGNDGVVQ